MKEAGHKEPDSSFYISKAKDKPCCRNMPNGATCGRGGQQLTACVGSTTSVGGRQETCRRGMGMQVQYRQAEYGGEGGGGGVVMTRGDMQRLLCEYRAPAGGATRWSPTAEQLAWLQRLFHEGGLRTPTTADISRITARLRAFGRIEGRNVFYWFQNQKARERKRRQLLGLHLSTTTAPPRARQPSSPTCDVDALSDAHVHIQPSQLQPQQSLAAVAHSSREYPFTAAPAAQSSHKTPTYTPPAAQALPSPGSHPVHGPGHHRHTDDDTHSAVSDIVDHNQLHHRHDCHPELHHRYDNRHRLHDTDVDEVNSNSTSAAAANSLFDSFPALPPSPSASFLSPSQPLQGQPRFRTLSPLTSSPSVSCIQHTIDSANTDHRTLTRQPLLLFPLSPERIAATSSNLCTTPNFTAAPPSSTASQLRPSLSRSVSSSLHPQLTYIEHSLDLSLSMSHH